MPWAIAPVHLPLDDERIDDAAGVLDAHPAADRDHARVGLDLHDRGLGARRERAADRIVEPRGIQARLQIGRHPMRSRGARRARSRPASPRDPARRARATRPVGHVEILDGRLQDVRGDARDLLAHRAPARAARRRRRSRPDARRRRRGRTAWRRCRRSPRARVSTGTPSSPATSCASVVSSPCPCEVTPASTVTAPEGSMRTVAPSWPVRNGMRGPAEAAWPRPVSSL